MPGLCAAELPYTIGPEPAWAEPMPLPEVAEPPVDQIGNGMHVLLCDEQTRVAPREVYGQYARKILTETGVQQGSEITIGVDPAYQTLELHKVEILREGEWQQRLTPAIVSVFQRETDMERYMLDGRLTVVIRLTDVRPGDVLRYSFTARGMNPVMKDHFFTTFYVNRGYPLARLRERVWAPRGMPLQVRNHGTDLTYTEKEVGDAVLYEWSASDLPPVEGEIDVPQWVTVYPRVEVSNMGSWKEVVDWALPLYDFTLPLSPALAAEVEKLKGLSDQDKVRSALRVAQDHVRYFGTETGEYSHKPREPSEVYAQRLGDCKEKALLLCTMLRQLGIEADPVLVSFSWGRGVENSLPTPYAFDHVIIAASVQGETYFLDPTSSYQRGPLRILPLTKFERGLVIRDGVTQLSEIPLSPEAAGKAVVEETLELPDMENAEPAIFKVHTTFSGKAAERQREQIATTSRAQLQKSFCEFYERIFPGVKEAQPMRMVDHEERNVLETWEEYRVPKIWKPNKDKHGVKVTVYPREIARYLETEGLINRRHPLQLFHPLEIETITKVRFPEDWKITPEITREKNKYFDFSQEIAGSGRDATVSTRYKTLRDHVPLQDLEKYSTAAETVYGSLGYVFTYDKGAGESVGFLQRILGLWPMLLTTIAFLYVGFIVSLGLWLIARNQPKAHCPSGTRHLDGLSGWLALVGVGIFLSPFAYLWSLIQLFLPFFQNSNLWGHFTQNGGAFYSPFWMPLFLFECAANSVLIALCLLQIVLFLKKRRIFPVFFSALTVLAVTAAIIDQCLLGLIPREILTTEMQAESQQSVVALWRSLISAAIWIPYMFCSRRARATFRR